MPLRLRVVAAAALFGLVGCTAAPPPEPTATTATTVASTTTTAPPVAASTTIVGGIPGSIGDPYFPELGNAGIDVEHYHLALWIEADTGEITTAAADLTTVAVSPLAEIALDLLGLTVHETRIDGTRVPHRREGAKLIVEPPSPIAAGTHFVVGVTYSGVPEPFFIPGFDTRAGWVVTAEGVHVVAEPDGARTWFPGNDHPADKATFAIDVTVPEPFVVVSNGRPVPVIETADGRTFGWRMDDPMATYLATVVIGELERVETGVVDGVPVADYLPFDLAAVPPPSLLRAPEMIEFLATWFGPYPFDRYGHVIVPEFSIALETQTMSVVGRGAVGEITVLHEIAHQWYGNSVSVATWRDIWLSEGFASYAELLWIEHDRGPAAMRQEALRRHQVMAQRTHPAIGDPGPEDMFDGAVYWRGALTLYALRAEIGDEAMRSLMKGFAERYRHGNAATADFIALAEEVTDRDLADFFAAWLFDPEIPPLPG
ncbi:MAG TPA: M1 family metallopeptidase [Acidimicrobiia bacterium]|nr:M1 family metallopeptidase [Acidimicrobiia bacterium]